MKNLRLGITCIILLSVTSSVNAKPPVGSGRSLPNHQAVFAGRIAAMTHQQYYDKLSAINDTLAKVYNELANRVLDAYNAKPMTWNKVKEYRVYLQYYYLSKIVYLSKLPDVGDSKDFAASLTFLLQTHNAVNDIIKEFDVCDANSSDDVLIPIFKKLKVGEGALVVLRGRFAAQKEAYKTKYALTDYKTTKEASVHTTMRLMVPVTAASQAYCNRLRSIFDTLKACRTLMFRDMDSAYSAKPRTWSIIGRYRKFMQNYCVSSLANLDKLPQVGDAKEFKSSLSDLINKYWELSVVCKVYEDQKPDIDEAAVDEIFKRFTVKKQAADASVIMFWTSMNKYQIKYGLPITD